MNAGAPRLPVRRNRASRTADLPALLDGVTHVFHLAAQAGVRKSWGRDFRIYTANNVDATQQLLEACVGRPIDTFVYASSSSVYGDAVAIPMREDALPQPVSPYGVTKLAAEQLCHLYLVNYEVPTTSVRYFTVYGPRQRPDMAFNRFIRAALADQPITLYGDGEQTRDFTFVTDAVAATIAAGDRGVPGRAYNIGGGSRVSVNDVLEIIERIAGHAARHPRVRRQKGDMRDTYADTSLARADLGFAPRCRSNRVSKRSIDGFRRHACAGLDEAALASFVSRGVAAAGRCWLRWPAARAGRRSLPSGTLEPDKFLFERGTEGSTTGTGSRAREYFRQLVDSYPQSRFRADAKLGVGDTLLGERSPESFVLAINEFREFLTFYPTHARADYAQFKLAMTHFYQMHGPERDQTETREAIRELSASSSAIPQQPADRRGAGAASARRTIGSASRSTASATSTSARAGIPARSTASRRSSTPIREFTEPRRRLLPPRRVAGQGRAAGGGAALLREADRGVRDERVPAEATKRSTELKARWQPARRGEPLSVARLRRRCRRRSGAQARDIEDVRPRRPRGRRSARD